MCWMEIEALERVLDGHAAPCVLAECFYCRRGFNPMAVACGSMFCPECLAEMNERGAIRTMPCSGRTVICTVRRPDHPPDLVQAEVRLALAQGRAVMVARAIGGAP